MLLSRTYSVLIIFVSVSAEGISNNLANYMTMALDPNVAQLVSYMSKKIPNYETLLKKLQFELELALYTSNISIIDLFHRVAIE